MQVPDAASYSMSLAMTFCLVLLHYRPRSYFLGSVAIASGTLRTVLDMLYSLCSFRLRREDVFYLASAPLSHPFLRFRPP